MVKPVLSRLEPRGRVQRYGVTGFDHLVVEAQYSDEDYRKPQLQDWVVIDTRFDQAFDKWSRWFVWLGPALSDVRNWVRAGGPSLWDPEKRKADKDWWPAPDGMRVGARTPGPRREGGDVPLKRRDIRRAANYCAAMMLYAAGEQGFGVSQDVIDDLGLSDEDVQRIEDEIDAIRQGLLDRSHQGGKRGPEDGGTRGEVPGRAHPGIGPGQRMAGGSRGPLRREGGLDDRRGDVETGHSAHREFRPDDVAGKKYAVCPAWVTPEDGGRRHVGFADLVQLYGVNESECLLIPADIQDDRLPSYVEDLVWLHPQPSEERYRDMREELARGADAFKLT
jgi:hypothetical protein